MSIDRLALLQTFARIAERGTISAAARDLGLSQASASRQLAELENRLGVQLVQRTTHSLALTEAGRDLLVEARGLLGGWDALVDRFADEDARVAGKLKVVAPVALGQLALIDAALAFRKRYGEVRITWLLQDEPVRFAEIGCDLWIRIGPVPDDTLIVRPLGDVERLIVAAPGLAGDIRAGDPDDLARMPAISLIPFEGEAIPLSGADGSAATLTARAALSTNNIFAAKAAALRGVGYAVMPRWFVAAELAAGALVDLLPEWRAAQLTISAAYLPARRQTRRLSLLLDHIADAVPRIEGVEPPGHG